MAIHELKVDDASNFAALAADEKKVEIRVDDRQPSFQRGDILILRLHDGVDGYNEGKERCYRAITHVLRLNRVRPAVGCVEDLVALSIEPVYASVHRAN